MVSRVLRGFGGGRQSGEIVVLNDEAHHCYMDKPITIEDEVEGVEQADAEDKERNEEARVWFKGIRAIQEHVGVKAVYDLSATPFYLGGSGYKEGYIFPWTVSDFSLMDAIESGIVKAPRIPVDDDAAVDTVTFRNLWELVGNDLPEARPRQDRHHELDDPGRARGGAEQPLPLLRARLRALAAGAGTARRAATGLHRRLPQHRRVQARPRLDRRHRGRPRRRHDHAASPGTCRSSRTDDGDTSHAKPRTILVDSAQLESGEAMKKDFKDAAAAEIDAFKARVPAPQPRRGRRRASPTRTSCAR